MLVQPKGARTAVCSLSVANAKHVRMSDVLSDDADFATPDGINDAGSIAACLEFVAMLWHLLGMTTPPAREWWLDAYVEAARGLEGEKDYRPRGGQFQSYVGPLWQFVAQTVREADRAGDSVLDACNRWFSGAYLLETMPNVLYGLRVVVLVVTHLDSPF